MAETTGVTRRTALRMAGAIGLAGGVLIHSTRPAVAQRPCETLEIEQRGNTYVVSPVPGNADFTLTVTYIDRDGIERSIEIDPTENNNYGEGPGRGNAPGPIQVDYDPSAEETKILVRMGATIASEAAIVCNASGGGAEEYYVYEDTVVITGSRDELLTTLYSSDPNLPRCDIPFDVTSYTADDPCTGVASITAEVQNTDRYGDLTFSGYIPNVSETPEELLLPCHDYDPFGNPPPTDSLPCN